MMLMYFFIIFVIAILSSNVVFAIEDSTKIDCPEEKAKIDHLLLLSKKIA